MASKTHEIHRYMYSFSTATGGAFGLTLWGKSGELARLRFVDDDKQVPPPTVRPDLSGATGFFKRSAASSMVDMLRNEKPVKLTVSDGPPGRVFIHTGDEPVGEEES